VDREFDRTGVPGRSKHLEVIVHADLARVDVERAGVQAAEDGLAAKLR